MKKRNAKSESKFPEDRDWLLYIIFSRGHLRKKELVEAVHQCKLAGIPFTYDDFVLYPGWHHSDKMFHDLGKMFLIGFIDETERGIEKGNCPQDYLDYANEKINRIRHEDKEIIDKVLSNVLTK